MQTTALTILAASGIWLVGVALMVAFRPQRFLNLLSLTAFSGRINNTEQGLRLLAGLAMTVRAEFSRLPGLFEIGG